MLPVGMTGRVKESAASPPPCAFFALVQSSHNQKATCICISNTLSSSAASNDDFLVSIGATVSRHRHRFWFGAHDGMAHLGICASSSYSMICVLAAVRAYERACF